MPFLRNHGTRVTTRCRCCYVSKFNAQMCLPSTQVFAGLLADSGLMWREKREPPYEE